MFPNKSVATAPTNLVLQLEKDTRHVIFSDHDRPMICPEEITWVHFESQDIEQLTEMVMAEMEHEMPVRVTLPVLQAFVGVLPPEDLIRAIDQIIDAVRGSCHIISVPSLRFIPDKFMVWPEVERVNEHIWRRHVKMAIPILLLHKSFLSRQQNKWVVCPQMYLEYVTDTGLGHTLTVNAKYRYSSRLLQFHASLHRQEPPCQVSSPVVPLPLYQTWSYVEKPETAEILQGLGCELKPRAMNKRGKKGKGEKSKGEGKAGVVTYAAPKPISVISIDEGTFKRVFRENCELRSDLKLLEGGLKDTEAHVTKLMTEIKELKGELKGAKAERDRYKEESRRTSRKYRKLDESTYQDMMDWREERETLEKDVYDLRWEAEELTKEVDEYKQKLQREKERYQVLEIQLSVWERWVEGEKKKDEKKRRKE